MTIILESGIWSLSVFGANIPSWAPDKHFIGANTLPPPPKCVRHRRGCVPTSKCRGDGKSSPFHAPTDSSIRPHNRCSRELQRESSQVKKKTQRFKCKQNARIGHGLRARSLSTCDRRYRSMTVPRLLGLGSKIIAIGRNYAAHAKELGNAVPEVGA